MWSMRQEHPLEFQLWDAVMTCWFMGWVGWLPTFALDAWWARAHTLNKLRCDWIKH